MLAAVPAQRGEVVPLPGHRRHAAAREADAVPRHQGEGDLAHPSETLLVVRGELDGLSSVQFSAVQLS